MQFARTTVCFLMSAGAFAQSGSNGVYGGYVGSERWFQVMRQSAQNQAALAALGRSGSGSVHVAPGFVEYAGVVQFPGGNPFPKQRLPDLRIVCRNPAADGVERAPWLDSDNSFYTHLKRGETYDVFWMYTFGGREQFGTITISRTASSPQRSVLTYSPPAPASSERRTEAPAATGPSWRDVASLNPDVFDLSSFPRRPTNFEEQKIIDAMESARGPGADPLLKADAHRRLANYYEARGLMEKARLEMQRSKYWSK
ncbi:MAG: hypothetical protein HY820_25075 [Acidobacteria bacterium]|nr:hypothetical protein [Acidobacteriota bacterium]